ncbi:hypothetical protein JZ751_005557 [Albula glossodonta]|uniref:Uncharacterized protein n=1 Tax=Albula glossodonta TaxID=121402 RepID=A0A8T2N461_9TELE|nr:hypothetical protein JZ751_005557 [Albula glossodonta]
MPTQWGLSPSRHTKASTTRDPSHPDRGLGSTPPLGSSDLTGGSNGQSESQNLTVPGPSLLPSTSGSLDQRSPAPQAALSSSPVSLDTPESNSTLSQPNASAPPAHTPPSRTTRSVATAPGFTVPKSLFGTPEGSLPLLTLSAQQGPLSGSDKPSVVTPVPPETAPAAFAPQRGPAYKVSSDYSSAGKASSSPPVSPTARSVGLDRLHSSRDPTLGDAAQGIHLLLNPPEVIAPSQVPVIRPHTTSATPEPTIVPPEEFYPTHTMEDDWGSGDYLETMSFMGPDGEDFSLVTSLPTELYDLEDSSSEVYDTSFPSRIVPALSSLHISSSPTLTSSYGYSLHTAAPMEPHPSHSGHPSPEPPVTSQNHGPADEGSDLDWADTYTIEPTEILLPDMNSLEYYTTLLAKENASAAGGRVNVTSSSSSSGHYGSLVTAHISPTRPFTAGPGHAPTASANTTEAEDSSADASGSGAVNTTAGDSEGVVRPHPADPLEPSVAPTPSMIASSSLWGGGVSAAPTPLPGATSSSAASIRPTTSLRPGGKWPVTATSTETILRPTATVTPHTTPKLTIASSSPPGSGVVADQGSTSEAPTSGPALTTVTDRRRTTTTVRTSTVSAGKTTTVSTTTGSPSVTTPRPPQITTARQYLCNITKTETYYVRVGKSVLKIFASVTLQSQQAI